MKRTQLSPNDVAKLDRAIWDALDPNVNPMRLAAIVETSKTYAGELGKVWDFYMVVSDELQRMKHAGFVLLVNGRGGGWIRSGTTVPGGGV